MLTVERVRQVLDYDPETGVFIWRYRPDVGQPSWNTKFAGKITGLCIGFKGYRQVTVDNKRYYAHRAAWAHFYGEWPPAQIDHINLNKIDNRIANLRLATQSENQWNRAACTKNTLGYKGVRLRRDGKAWIARIGIDGKGVHLGSFATPEAAAAAYAEAAQRLHGDFARTGR